MFETILIVAVICLSTAVIYAAVKLGPVTAKARAKHIQKGK